MSLKTKATLHEGWNSGPTMGGQEPKRGGTLQKLPRSCQALEGIRCLLQQLSVQISINLATTLLCLISVDTAFQCIATKNKNPRPRARIVSLLLFYPTVTNLSK